MNIQTFDKMKMNKNLRKILFSSIPWFLVALVVISCSDDDDAPVNLPTEEDIVSIAQATPELSSLVEALIKYPDLVNTLSGPGTFTVFAPTNNAFTAVLGAIGQSSIDDLPEEVLRDILEYHVVATAELFSADLTDGQTAGTVNGSSVVVSINGNTVLINQSQVTTPDIDASNGVIHIVDAVLVPPAMLPIVGTIVAPVYFDKDFTTLVAAVLAADGDILSVLLSNGPSDNGLTLFAPTNAAFEAAGITELPDAATLNAVLRYHVLDATVGSGDLPAGSADIQTLNGKFYLSNVDAGVFINGSTQVTEVDITGTNGVVHVIDRTLLPPSMNIAEIVTDFATGDSPEFTLLLAALQTADLVDFFVGDGPITVFAPVDAAFNRAGFPDVASVEAADPDVLASILTHHVVKGDVRVFSPDLTDGQMITMLNDQDVTVDLQNLTIQDAAGSDPAASLIVDLLNVHATNGVVHVINEVLLPAQ
jgi:transforming growth factor-beta-induced protein